MPIICILTLLDILFCQAPAVAEEKISYDIFKQKFQLASTSTEKRHSKTFDLSQTTRRAPAAGLGQLLEVEEELVGCTDDFDATVQNVMENQSRLDFLDHAEYTVCLDGGGSRTWLQILDAAGQTLLLQRGEESSTSLFEPGSNINTIGLEGFEKLLARLLDDLYVGADRIPFSQLQPRCRVIGGFAGLASPVNQKIALEMFLKRGFRTHQLMLLSDPHLALQIIPEHAIVLIAGTGSIALGLQNGQEIRTGGFGRLLGDQGSGYAMGVEAMRAALEDEYGYGRSTSLTRSIQEEFHLTEVKLLTQKVHSGEIAPAEIAHLAQAVLAAAKEGDAMAQEIVERAAHALATLVRQVADRMERRTLLLILSGGLFKPGSQLSARVIDLLASDGRSYTPINLSGENSAAYYTRRVLLGDQSNGTGSALAQEVGANSH